MKIINESSPRDILGTMGNDEMIFDSNMMIKNNIHDQKLWKNLSVGG